MPEPATLTQQFLFQKLGDHQGNGLLAISGNGDSLR
jgi:hypothetical protein